MAEAIATLGYRHGGQEAVVEEELETKVRRLVAGITSEAFEAPDNEHTQAYVNRPDDMSMTVYVDGMVVVQHLHKTAKKVRRADTAEEMTEWILAFVAKALKTTPKEGWASSPKKLSSLPGKAFRPCTWEGEVAVLQAEHGEGAELLEAVVGFLPHADYGNHAEQWLERHGLVVNKDAKGPEVLSRLLRHKSSDVRWRSAKLLARAFKARKAKDQNALLPVLHEALTADDEQVVHAASLVELKRSQSSPGLVEALLERMKKGSCSSNVAENLVRLFDWKRTDDPAIVEVAKVLLDAEDRWARHLVRQEIENRTLRHGKGPIRDQLEAVYRASPAS